MDKHPHITLINKMIPFVFVIPPTDLKISQSQNHKPIEIIDLGEILRDGKRETIKISWSGFLPLSLIHI